MQCWNHWKVYYDLIYCNYMYTLHMYCRCPYKMWTQWAFHFLIVVKSNTVHLNYVNYDLSSKHPESGANNLRIQGEMGNSLALCTCMFDRSMRRLCSCMGWCPRPCLLSMTRHCDIVILISATIWAAVMAKGKDLQNRCLTCSQLFIFFAMLPQHGHTAKYLVECGSFIWSTARS